MMRILHVSGVRGLTMSGAEQVLLDLVNCLADSGYESQVVVSGPGSLTSLLQSREIACVYQDIAALFPQRRTPALTLGFLSHLVSAARQLAREVRGRKIQLIVTHTRGGHWYGWLAGRLAGVPVVMYYHDLSQSKLSRLTKAFLALNARKVIAISKAVREDLASVPVVGRWVDRKITTIPNAVDLERFHPNLDGSAIKAELDLETAFPVVALIGQLAEWKGQLDLIKAAPAVARAFPIMKLLLIGGPVVENANYEERLRELVKTLGLDDQVTFTGHRNDIPECMAALDIFVSASWVEPFGLVIIEAMASGKPVIGTYAGATPEIVTEGETGLLVPPHDADALADAIIKLASNRDTLRRMGQAGRRRAEACYSMKRWCEDVRSFFTTVLKDITA